MPLAIPLLLPLALAGDETFSERHGKKVDTSTFSGRFSGQSHGPSSPDEKAGWHEAAFGAAVLPDMRCVPLSTTQPHRECEREGKAGDRVVGDFHASKVSYHYWKDQLYEVIVSLPDQESASVSLRALSLKYGPPTLDGAFPQWHGSIIHITTSPTADGLRILFTDAGTLTELLDAQKEAGLDPAAKAAIDL